MKGLKRSHRCAELNKANIGETVTVMGWVQKNRNKGGIVFVDLRDRSGILQLIFENGDVSEEDFEKAEIEGKNLGTDIKLAMEEYTNTGFAKMMYKTSTIPGYIESMEEIVADILEKD